MFRAGSQNNGPREGGCIYRLDGSCAPVGPFRGGPPCIPGKPRPALVNGGGLLFKRAPEFGANWEVVEGVKTLAGNPLVGADEG